MINKINGFIFGTLLLLGVIGQFALPSYSGAAPTSSTSTSCGGSSTSGSAKSQVLGGVGATGNECDSSTVGKTVKRIVQLLLYVTGAIAVIMVIYSGFSYITSAGDSNKVNSAKNTLIYAIIGLIIAALANTIVSIVIKESTSTATSSSTTRRSN